MIETKKSPGAEPGELKTAFNDAENTSEYIVPQTVPTVEHLPVLEAALLYAQHGWQVFPCNPVTKAPNIRVGFKNATTGANQIRAWWERWPIASIGLAIPKGYAVLDIDPRNDGSLEHAEQLLGRLPDTLTALSGRNDGGQHLWFTVPQDISVTSRLGPGLDMKVGGKGYVIVAPSIHAATGQPYAWDYTSGVASATPQMLEMFTAPKQPKNALPVEHHPLTDSAAEGLLNRVRNSVEGERDDIIFWAANRALDSGQDELLDDIREAAQQTGQLDWEIDRAINSAQQQTRQPPGSEFEPVEHSLYTQPDLAADGGLIVTRASDIKPKRQKFIRKIDGEGVIPLQACTVFAGIGGEGKSSFALDQAARLSRGELEGDVEGLKGSTIIFGPEDDWETAMVPRLMAAGADRDYVLKVAAPVVTAYGTQERELKFPLDIAKLEVAVARRNVKLIIVDPISTSLDGDMNKVQDVREALGALTALAQRHDLAVIVINHFRKSGANVADKMSGSHAIRDTVRSYLAFATDTNSGDRVVSQDKSNYSTSVGSWKFRLVNNFVEIEGDKKPAEIPSVEMLGISDVTVGTLLEREAGYVEADENRKEWEHWLLELLEEEGGKLEVSTIRKAATGAGLTFKTIQNGRSKITNPRVITSSTGNGLNKKHFWKIETYSGAEEDFSGTDV